jgi:hypothetical protein
MIVPKKTARKITLATGVVTMAIGLITAFSIEAKAVATGGGEKGPSQVVDCAGWGTGDKTVCNATNNISCTPHGCS